VRAYISPIDPCRFEVGGEGKKGGGIGGGEGEGRRGEIVKRKAISRIAVFPT